MTCKVICPKCSSDKRLAVVKNVMYMSNGPEGPLHVLQCIDCGKELHCVKLPNNVNYAIPRKI